MKSLMSGKEQYCTEKVIRGFCIPFLQPLQHKTKLFTCTVCFIPFWYDRIVLLKLFVIGMIVDGINNDM
jgi:hypothetical protein